VGALLDASIDLCAPIPRSDTPGRIALPPDGIAGVLGQLARGLQRSLATYQVYEDDGRDPADSVAHSVNALTEAIGLLQRVGPLLDDAQAAIARQGYRTAVPGEVGGVAG
jgi:hypothetical protein